MVLITFDEQVYYMCLVMAVIMGFINCSHNTLTYVMISKYYKSQFELYSLYNVMWALVNIIMISFQMFIQPFSTNLFILLLILSCVLINVTLFKFQMCVKGTV